MPDCISAPSKELCIEWSKGHGATHVYVGPNGSMDFYRPALSMPGAWLRCRFTLAGDFYYSDKAWELTSRTHPHCEALQ
jgi:hypothetical protein